MLVDSVNDSEGVKAARITASQRSRPWISVERIPYFLSTADALTILLVSVLSPVIYQFATKTIIFDLLPYGALGLIATVVFVIRISGQGYYEFERALKRVEVTRVLVCWTSTAFLLAFCAFILKIGVDFSRGAVVIFALASPVFLIVNRILVKAGLAKLSARNLIGHIDTLVFADQNQVNALFKSDLIPLIGIDQSKYFLLPPSDALEHSEPLDATVMQAALDAIRENPACQIFLLVPWSDLKLIEHLRAQLRLLPATVKLLPDVTVSALCDLGKSGALTRRSLVLELQRPPLSSLELTVKRLLDVVISIVALAFYVPIMLFAALAIKLDSEGPVVFRQFRKGFSGKTFTMFKFRTMSVQENSDHVQQASRNDPRVTRVGRWLRASSIDELPQLFNVLMGDMSLIGPRPHALVHDTRFMEVVANYAFRQHVKPGMTGWAQVNGARGATPSVDSIARRVELDIWYIDNWSLRLDLQIMVMTAIEVLRKRNAY